MSMQTRPIPRTGEALPVVGCGTYRGFDVSQDSAAYRRLPGVVQALLGAGGSVLDSSPMYGRAEDTTGRLLEDAAARDRAFVATKVWARGRAEGIRQMEQSLRLLRTRHVDLLQVHNLVDWRTHLDTLAGWKADGRTRYVGVTHYHSGAHDELETVLRHADVDFVQLDYSFEDRAAEKRLLPLAAERGIAVLVNLPFGGGSLVTKLSRDPLPSFAPAVGCNGWTQLLLKFVLGHPAVTCAIPGTSNPEHMAANAAAGQSSFTEAREQLLAWVGAGRTRSF
jgi:aryl-alcohol dehydrogenase-like predicted oxidoreductase